MIHYEFSLFDLKDVATTTTRNSDRWSLRLTHKPTGEFVVCSGPGQYQHALAERRAAVEQLKQIVDDLYKEQYDNNK